MTKEKIERNGRILRLYKKGHTLRSIADIEDISHERVRQILKLSTDYKYRKFDKKLTQI